MIVSERVSEEESQRMANERMANVMPQCAASLWDVLPYFCAKLQGVYSMQPPEFGTKSGDLRLKVDIKQHLVPKWVKGSFFEEVPFYLRDYKEEAYLCLECNLPTLAQK
jgi:hypothetical protein